MAELMTCLSFLVCAAVASWLFRKFWSLRKPLHYAQKVDVHITSDGLYASLPIYHYMKCHLHFVLFASGAVLLTSLAFAVCSLAGKARSNPLPELSPLPFLEAVSTLLTVVLGVHTAFIACYESTKPNNRISDQDILRGLQGFRQKLWTHALLLFSFIIVVMVWQAVLSAVP